MPKEYQVVIVEDDPYARDLMTLLLTRDWRTRVTGVFGCSAEAGLKNFLLSQPRPVDVIIVDTEVPQDPRWPWTAAQIGRSLKNPPAILYTCTRPDPAVLEHAIAEKRGGYLIKDEILYALASAVTSAADGNFVITPGVLEAADQRGLPERTQILDGRVPVASFTRREADLVRLGILFNLAQRDIADELVVSTDFVAEVMGHIYTKLGLHEILSGESPLEAFFSDPNLVERCRAVLSRGQKAGDGGAPRKAPWMSTIAFHLLTVPEKEEL